MELSLILIIYLTFCNVRLTTGEDDFTNANLKSLYELIENVKNAANIQSAVETLPPTLANILLATFSKSETIKDSNRKENDNTKQQFRNIINHNNQHGQHQMSRSAYDFVVDLTRPTDIYGKLKAYPISFPLGKSAYENKTRYGKEVSSRFIVNVVGRYNVGKTYVLRLLANINLGHSFTERTSGISVSLPTPRNKYDPNIALIDTAGSRTPVYYDSKTFHKLAYEKQISDAFIQEIALNSSEIFLFVINQLTLDDQLYLKMLHKRMKEKKISGREIKQRLLIVHNYFNLHTTKEIEETAQYELGTLFNATEQNEGHWLSQDYKHFILANSESEAGRFYNNHTIDQLLTMIKASNAMQVNNVLEHIVYEIERLLKKFLEEKPKSQQEDSETKDSRSITATVQLGIDSQKELELYSKRQIDIELEITQVSLAELKPESLWFICAKKPLSDNIILSNDLKFNEDGSVYIDYSSQFMPDIHIAQLNNYGDIQILIECPSCEDKSIDVQVRGTKLIVQGEKMNTKMTKDYLNTRRTGKFELEIPVAKLEEEKTFDFTKRAKYFRDGILTIIVPTVRDTLDTASDSNKVKSKTKGWFG